MSDLIRRIDAAQACQVGPSDEWSRSAKGGYNQAATDCAMNILRIPAAQPDAREMALREALEAVNAKWRSGAADTPDEMRGLALAEAAILDLIDKPGHVNEPPKSEHDARDVLTPATKGGAHD